MFELRVTHDFARLKEGLTGVARRQLPFATANALNDVARQAVRDMQQQMPRILDRPTRFTLNAVYANTRARKNSLSASVAIRFSAPKGTPAEVYLRPQIEGGGRETKKSERRIAAAPGFLADGEVQTIPARGAILDGHGNMSRVQINAILAHLRAYGNSGQNVSDRTLRRLKRRGLVRETRQGMAKYFIARSRRDGSPLGVWNFLGRGHVQPVLLFARRRPTYRPRFDFKGIALGSFAANFHRFLETRLREAIATAR